MKECKKCEFFKGYNYDDGTPACSYANGETCPYHGASSGGGRRMKPYRSWMDLLSAEESTLDCDETTRLRRINETPVPVRAALLRRVDDITDAVMELERERDSILDFLNGEVVKDGI